MSKICQIADAEMSLETSTVNEFPTLIYVVVVELAVTVEPFAYQY
jgi:hypothetical protein